MYYGEGLLTLLLPESLAKNIGLINFCFSFSANLLLCYDITSMIAEAHIINLSTESFACGSPIWVLQFQ